jgi:hypothetical protein
VLRAILAIDAEHACAHEVLQVCSLLSRGITRVSRAVFSKALRSARRVLEVCHLRIANDDQIRALFGILDAYDQALASGMLTVRTIRAPHGQETTIESEEPYDVMEIFDVEGDLRIPRNVQVDGKVQFYNTTGDKYAALSGASVTTSYGLKWPATIGIPGQFLELGNNSQLIWGNGGGSTATNNKASAYVDLFPGAPGIVIVADAVPQDIICGTVFPNLNPGVFYNPGPGVGAGEYTAPAEGVYAISAQVSIEYHNCGSRQVDLYKNGVVQPGYTAYTVTPVFIYAGGPAFYDTGIITLVGLVYLQVGDKIKFRYTGFQNDVLLNNKTHISINFVSANL